MSLMLMLMLMLLVVVVVSDVLDADGFLGASADGSINQKGSWSMYGNTLPKCSLNGSYADPTHVA